MMILDMVIICHLFLIPEEETESIFAWIPFGRILIAMIVLCAIVLTSIVFVMIATLMKEPAERPKSE